MNILKLFRLRSRIAKRITELENEVSQLRKNKKESIKNYNADYYLTTVNELSNKRAVITELKSLI